MEVLFLLIGCVFFGGGAWALLRLKKSQQDGRMILGELVDYEIKSAPGAKHESYSPIVRINSDGTTRYLSARVSSPQLIGGPGDKIPVLTSRRDSGLGLVLLPMFKRIAWIFLLVGSVLIAVFLRMTRLDSFSPLLALIIAVPFFAGVFRQVSRIRTSLARAQGGASVLRGLFSPLLSEQEFQDLRKLGPTAALGLKKKERVSLRRGAYVCAILGAAMIFGGLKWFDSLSQFVQSAARAQGHVVELHAAESSKSTVYYPVVEFATSTNERVRFRHRVGASHPSYRVGDAVAVLYARQSPKDAMIDAGPWWNFLGPMAIVSLGIVFLLFAFFALRPRDLRPHDIRARQE